MNLNFWKKETSSYKDSDQSSDQSEGVEYQYTQPEDTVPVPVESSEYYQPVEPADPEKARLYNNISRWALYVGIFLLPLFFLPWTTSILELNKQMLLVGVAGVGIIAWLLGVVSSGYLSWRSNPLDKGVVALLSTFVLAAVFSITKFTSLFGLNVSLSNSLASILALTIVYFLVVNNIEDRGKALKSLLGFSIVLTLLYGLLQMFGVHILRSAFTTSKAFNTVGSLNVIGILAAISLPLFSRSRLDVSWLKYLYLEKIGVVLALAVLVILNWWVLWTVAIGGMVAVIIFGNLGGGRFTISRLILPMTVVVLGVFFMIVNLNLDAFKRNLPIEVAPSFRLSKDVAQSVLREKPAFGYGLENFSLAFDKYGAARLANTALSNARFFDSTSEAITLVVHGGLVMLAGLAFLLWCLGMVFWRFYRYSMENHGQLSVKEDIGVLASMAALLVALFFYPFNLTLMLMLYVFMGLVILTVFDKERKGFNIEEKTSLSLASSLGFIGGLILVLVGVYFGTTNYLSDVKYAQALAAGDKQKAASLLVEAINWNNKDDRYYRFGSQVALNLLAAELNKKADPDRNARIQNYLTTSISLARRATEVAPQEALNWANLGSVYQNLLTIVDGVDKLSEDAYLKAAELRPGDAAFYHRIGMLYLAKFDLLRQLVAVRRADPSRVARDTQDAIKKAEESLKKAVEISNNFGLAIYNLGAVYDRQGKISDAIKQLEKIMPFNNNQPGLAFELGLLYYRAGRKEEAFSQLQRAVILAPDYANARWYLALIHEERRELSEAISQLERILSVEVNRDNQVVTAKLTELKAGRTTIPPQTILDQQPLP